MRLPLRASLIALTLTCVASVASAQQTFKLAYVNTEALMAAAPGRAALDSVLQREAEGYRLALKKLQDSLNAMLLDYQKKEATLTAVTKESRQKAMETLNNEIQAK